MSGAEPQSASISTSEAGCTPEVMSGAGGFAPNTFGEEPQSAKCKTCNEEDLNKFKPNSRICRVCFNLKQNTKVKCEYCSSIVNVSYLQKHIRNKHFR